MYANAHLTGSQAIINITTSFSVSGVLIFYISKRATAYGTIIEFIDDTNTSPSSPREIVSDIKNEKTKEVFKNFESKQDSVAIAEANKCYIAWLVKTGHIKQGRIKELRQMYDFTELNMLVDKYSASELQEKSKGYDRKLRRFIAR
jgi:predicted nucleic acid-binding protein